MTSHRAGHLLNLHRVRTGGMTSNTFYKLLQSRNIAVKTDAFGWYLTPGNLHYGEPEGTLTLRFYPDEFPELLNQIFGE